MERLDPATLSNGHPCGPYPQDAIRVSGLPQRDTPPGHRLTAER
jgi:hypothetical protein